MSSPFAPIEGIKNTIDTKSITAFAPKTLGEGQESFGSVFASILGQANDAQNLAGEMSTKLVSGQLQNTHQMSIAGAKAEVMLHLTTQIASKLSSATTQLFQMQL